jgi:hypothetical protein
MVDGVDKGVVGDRLDKGGVCDRLDSDAFSRGEKRILRGHFGVHLRHVRQL